MNRARIALLLHPDPLTRETGRWSDTYRGTCSRPAGNPAVPRPRHELCPNCARLASHGCGGQVRVVRLSEDRINQPIECHMCSVGCQEAAASLAGPGPKQRYRRDHCLK